MTRRKLGKLVEWQHTREIDTGRSCGERSPYWDWTQARMGSEDTGAVPEFSQANPDTLGVEDSPPGHLRVSVGDLSKRLSGQQKKVFALYIEQGRSEAEIAGMLKISRQSVSVYLQRIREKLKRYI